MSSNGSGGDDPDDRDDKRPANPFDPQRLRIGQRTSEGQDVRRIIVSMPVRKPHRQEFVRTHADPRMWFEAAILEFKQDRQTFIVSPELAPLLPGEAVSKVLVPTLTNHGAMMLWPIRLPDEQGRLDEWNATAFAAAERAKDEWLRLMAQMAAQTYEVVVASAQFPDPVWPDLPLEKLLELAFRGRVIDTMDHPVLLRLRGEI